MCYHHIENVHQKISSSESTCHTGSRAHANVHTLLLHPSRYVEEEFRAKAHTVPSCTSAQQKKSNARNDKLNKPEPIAKQLMRKISDTYSPVNEACTLSNDCEDQSILNTSRPLQDISNHSHLPGLINKVTHFNSDSDVTTCATSPLYENLPVKVPLTKNAVINDVSHDTTTRRSSTSSLGTATEEIYENIHDLVSPQCYTVPAGWVVNCEYKYACIIYFAIGTCPIIISNDGDSDVDDGLYVIDHVDQYLESKNMSS